MIALNVAQALEDAGATVTEASNLSQGLALVANAGFSGAVLDHGLGNDDSSSLCERLKQQGIPFLIYSGFPVVGGPAEELPISPNQHRRAVVRAVARVMRAVHSTTGSRPSGREASGWPEHMGLGSVLAQPGLVRALVVGVLRWHRPLARRSSLSRPALPAASRVLLKLNGEVSSSGSGVMLFSVAEAAVVPNSRRAHRVPTAPRGGRWCSAPGTAKEPSTVPAFSTRSACPSPVQRCSFPREQPRSPGALPWPGAFSCALEVTAVSRQPVLGGAGGQYRHLELSGSRSPLAAAANSRLNMASSGMLMPRFVASSRAAFKATWRVLFPRL